MYNKHLILFMGFAKSNIMCLCLRVQSFDVHKTPNNIFAVNFDTLIGQ